MPVSRLALTDFRSYPSALIEPGPGFVLLSGENGAGKTNLLEAVSLLSPGRGLRGAALSEMARIDGAGGFAVAARLGDVEVGTGTQPAAPERRQVRINTAPASVNSLSEWLSVLWLTPAMDRLFLGSAGERRRFLDRLVLALEPGHAHHSSRYEAAMRARTKLLTDEAPADPSWLAALEQQMAEHGTAIAGARARTVGPHRQDLLVTHRAKQMSAARSSTGEQKALLLGLVLAHAELVTERRGEPPILLLDEVAAHLDPKRRAALFARLEGRGQVWMTATEAALFDGVGQASRFHVAGGSLSPH